MTFNEETLDNIFGYLTRLDSRLGVLDTRLDAFEERLDALEGMSEPDDEYSDGEIEGLIDQEVDYDAITEGI